MKFQTMNLTIDTRQSLRNKYSTVEDFSRKITAKPTNVIKCKKNENKLFIIIIIIIIIIGGYDTCRHTPYLLGQHNMLGLYKDYSLVFYDIEK